MLHRVKPKQSSAAATADAFQPDFLAPLLLAGQSDQALTSTMLSIIRSFGFESFLYVMTTAPHMDVDSQIYFWTNQPSEWIEIYDQRSYIEIDPRPALSEHRVTPLVWDISTIPDKPEYKRFLKAAARFGICSGVVIPVPDSDLGRAGLNLHSPNPRFDSRRKAEIRDAMGDLILLAVHLHQMFMRTIVNVPPAHKGAPLSRREIQCLTLAAQGIKGPDIARRLQISERTIQFHFSNVNSKLGTANRAEAIAHALQRHMLDL